MIHHRMWLSVRVGQLVKRHQQQVVNAFVVQGFLQQPGENGLQCAIVAQRAIAHILKQGALLGCQPGVALDRGLQHLIQVAPGENGGNSSTRQWLNVTQCRTP